MERKRTTTSGAAPLVTASDTPPVQPSPRPPVLLAVLLTSLVWLLLAGAAMLLWRAPTPIAFELQPPPATFTPAPTPTPAPWQIEVTGAVLAPGVFTLPAQARVADAIAAAGGLAADADAATLNLARLLQDGEKLAVPVSQPAAALPITATRSNDLAAPAAPINLNTASAAELEALPAIGPVTAQAIVDYRTANGPFTSVDALDQVKGIGAATLDKLRDFVTVAP